MNLCASWNRGDQQGQSKGESGNDALESAVCLISMLRISPPVGMRFRRIRVSPLFWSLCEFGIFPHLHALAVQMTYSATFQYWYGIFTLSSSLTGTLGQSNDAGNTERFFSSLGRKEKAARTNCFAACDTGRSRASMTKRKPLMADAFVQR